MLNNCEFIGHLGADPEVRSAPSGDKIANLRLAVTESWKDKNSGEWRELTEWIPISVFNQALAAKAERSLRKGSKIFVSGAWKSRKWTDKDGNERHVTELAIQNYNGKLIPLDPRPAAQSETPSARSDSKPLQRPGRQSHAKDWGDLDDEIPFD